MKGSQLKFWNWPFAILFFGTLITGALLTGWAVIRENVRMHEQLLMEGRIVANAINWRFVDQLAGDSSDLGSPAYQRLKEQLTLVCSAHPTTRFVYLMGRKPDGTIFFFLDSESPDSDDYSPPGQAYPEASETMSDIFINGREATESLLPDQWGNWVSCLIPLDDPETNETIALLGMDVDAKRWNLQLLYAATIPGGITLLLLIIESSLFIFRRRTLKENLRLIASEGVLRESERRYRQLVEHAPAGIYEIDLSNHRFLSVNDVICQYMGLSREEILSMNPMELLTEASQKLFQERLMNILAGREVDSTAEYKVRIKEGKEIWVLLNAQYFYENNKPVRASVVIYDISTIKQAELALKESELKFRTVVENAQAVIFILDPDGNFLLSEGRALAKLGFKPGQVVGSSSLETYKDYPDVVLGITKALKGEEQQAIVEVQGIVFDTLFSPVLDAEGKISMIISIATDITDLVEAKNRAEESDRLKSAFLANMSHEIRTPMNGIVGFAQLLTEPGFTEVEKQHFAEIINKNSHDLLSIIHDIVDISKIEAGQERISNDAIDLDKLFEDLDQLFQPEARKLGLKFVLNQQVPRDLSRILGDPTKLRQILKNLLTNALKFTEEGEIILTSQHENGKLIFNVQDTGVGIDRKFHEVIFDRFRQADFPKTSRYRGAGLGLSISKAYVEMLGGQIHLESAIGKGTTFSVEIPLQHAVEKADAIEKRVKPVNTGKPDWKGKTFLLVEDEQDNAWFFKEVLKPTGASVLLAETGTQAIDLFQSHPEIDLVIMDIKLPELDGLEVTRRIKAVRPDLPVIATTAFALSGDKEKCLDAGCNEYFSKPVRIQIFLETLAKYI